MGGDRQGERQPLRLAEQSANLTTALGRLQTGDLIDTGADSACKSVGSVSSDRRREEEDDASDESGDSTTHAEPEGGFAHQRRGVKLRHCAASAERECGGPARQRGSGWVGRCSVRIGEGRRAGGYLFVRASGGRMRRGGNGSVS